ncbi:hypothetical protein ACIBEA_41820 [Streptomyces sp. NPDC051555]|uniref:hypothetical protein n=1 Tax=Streptomyces sp. NPDC051555 TaxID=3365657 RepID=UPI0037B6CC92
MSTPVSWCHWHAGSSSTALPIQYAAREDGTVVLLYACAPCREQRGLTPRWPPRPPEPALGPAAPAPRP